MGEFRDDLIAEHLTCPAVRTEQPGGVMAGLGLSENPRRWRAWCAWWTGFAAFLTGVHVAERAWVQVAANAVCMVALGVCTYLATKRLRKDWKSDGSS